MNAGFRPLTVSPFCFRQQGSMQETSIHLTTFGKNDYITWRIHGTIVYLPTWMVDFYCYTFNMFIDLATERHQWLHNIIQIEESSAPVLQLSPLKIHYFGRGKKHHGLYNMLCHIYIYICAIMYFHSMHMLYAMLYATLHHVIKKCLIYCMV